MKSWNPDWEAERQFEIIAPRLSWAMLVALEPRLEALLHAARTADSPHRGEHFCAQRFWHQELKPRLVQTIGHCRPDFHPILDTSAAYDLAYDTLCDAVPPCRNCWNSGDRPETGDE